VAFDVRGFAWWKLHSSLARRPRAALVLGPVFLIVLLAGLPGGIGQGILVGGIGGLFLLMSRTRWPRVVEFSWPRWLGCGISGAGLGIVTGFGLSIGAAVGLVTAASRQVSAEQVASPSATLAADRRAWLVFGVLCGLGFGFGFGLTLGMGYGLGIGGSDSASELSVALVGASLGLTG